MHIQIIYQNCCIKHVTLTAFLNAGLNYIITIYQEWLYHLMLRLSQIKCYSRKLLKHFISEIAWETLCNSMSSLRRSTKHHWLLYHFLSTQQTLNFSSSITFSPHCSWISPWALLPEGTNQQQKQGVWSPLKFPSDSGIVDWSDIQLTSTSATVIHTHHHQDVEDKQKKGQDMHRQLLNILLSLIRK